MPYSEGAQVALVHWANSFPLERKAESINDFLDGHLLSQVLKDLDPSFDQNTTEGALSNVYKGINRLVYRECPGLSGKVKAADIRSRAGEAQPEAVTQLLAVLFAVAMLGTDNERFVVRITTDVSDKSDLFQLQRITQDMKTAMDEADAADLDEVSDAPHESHDADLAMEADNIRLRSDLDKKGKLLADMETRLGHLQESYDDLKDEVVAKGRELEAFHSAQDGAGKEVIRSLELKLREQDELIANQEAQAEDDRIAKERLVSEVSALKAKTQKLEALDDEVKELRFKNEELSRKANMVERYKQKLEAQSTLSKEMDNLLYEKEQMQRDLIEYEKVLKRNQALEQTNEQYASKLRDYELQYVELDAQRRALHDDTMQLRARLASLDAQRLSDERLISELQEQINAGTGHLATSPDAASAGFSLEQELEGAGSSAPPNLSLEVSRLKAENNLLRSGMGSASENARLRQELEDERRQRERLQTTYNETFEKHQLAEAQVSALIGGGGENEVLANLKVQLAQKTHELESEKRRLIEVQAQLADKDRELLSARTDLSAVAKDSVNALEELKSTDQLISASVREELEAARQQIKNLSADLESRQSSLINTLLEKDKLRKELDEVKEGRQDGAEPTEAAHKLQEKVDKLRVRLKERQSVSKRPDSSAAGFTVEVDTLKMPAYPQAAVLYDSIPNVWPRAPHLHARIYGGMYQRLGPPPRKEGWAKGMASKMFRPANASSCSKSPSPAQLEKSEKDKYDLQQKLKAAEGGEAAAAQKAASDQVIKNLQRENALIATAWYDLTSRIQSNHVVLQRRNEVPKSWLGKQRQMVNATPRR